MKKRAIIGLAILVAVLALDLFTKYLAHAHLALGQQIELLPFFQLVHVRNMGAAFGMFGSMGNGFFIGVSLFAIVLLVWLFIRNEMNYIGLSLVMGGAIGNLADRVMLGYVRDFLDFYIGSYHWPAFNVADAALTVGIGIMLISPFFEKKSPEK